MQYPKIEGGYVLRPRSTKHSDLAHSPPVVREIFEWLVREANHDTNKTCTRGQCIRTYKDMQDGLHWMQGFIKRQYSKWDCERALKALRMATRIATQKTTRGLLITIVNYDFYQNPKNYKTETLKPTRMATRKPQRCATINNNVNNGITKSGENIPPTIEEVQKYCAFKNYFVNAERFVRFYESKGWLVGKNKMKNWHSAAAGWAAKDKAPRRPKPVVKCGHCKKDIPPETPLIQVGNKCYCSSECKKAAEGW